MAPDYGHFADGSSTRTGYRGSGGVVRRGQKYVATKNASGGFAAGVEFGFGTRALAGLQFRIRSVDAELLLQARRRGRVLEHQPLVRIDITMGLLRHQCPLVEPGQ